MEIQLGTVAVAICAAFPAIASTTIFEQPQQYVGKTVKLCGYIDMSTEYTGIWPDERAKNSRGPGLGVLYYGHSAKALNMKMACLTGEIIKTGCKTDKTKICNWSDVDYAIRVNGIR